MINGDLLLLTGWWLNHPSEKYYSSQHGNLPQRGVEIKNIWSHYLAIYTPKKWTNSLNKGTIWKEVSIFQALFFTGHVSFWGGNPANNHKSQGVTKSHTYQSLHEFTWCDCFSAQGGKRRSNTFPPVCWLTLGSPTLSLLLASPVVHTTSLVSFWSSWNAPRNPLCSTFRLIHMRCSIRYHAPLRFQKPRWKAKLKDHHHWHVR